MDEHGLRALLLDVRAGRVSRRRFLRTMIGLGLTAPMAAQMLASAGAAAAQTSAPAFTPTRRGGGGSLKMLYWQAPTILNPHLNTGVKDIHAARIFYEPLAHFDRDGHLVPILAADIPSRENGQVAADGTWATWNLKKGVTWHDGRPFTADDVVFTWQYAADPATAATTVGTFRELERVEKLHDHAVKYVFKKPTPFWAEPALPYVIPRHSCGETPYTSAVGIWRPPRSRPGSSGRGAPDGREANRAGGRTVPPLCRTPSRGPRGVEVAGGPPVERPPVEGPP
jgi:peptide/nickel transport system substrate-binding protein